MERKERMRGLNQSACRFIPVPVPVPVPVDLYPCFFYCIHFLTSSISLSPLWLSLVSRVSPSLSLSLSLSLVNFTRARVSHAARSAPPPLVGGAVVCGRRCVCVAHVVCLVLALVTLDVAHVTVAIAERERAVLGGPVPWADHGLLPGHRVPSLPLVRDRLRRWWPC